MFIEYIGLFEHWLHIKFSMSTEYFQYANGIYIQTKSHLHCTLSDAVAFNSFSQTC